MIKEVIVVEGKDDIAAVKAALDCQVLATHGYKFDHRLLDRLKAISKRCGIIVLTDPDYAGGRIRDRIRRAVPGAKHAYIEREASTQAKTGDIGVENAPPEAIIRAIQKARPETRPDRQEFTLGELVCAGLAQGPGAKDRRMALGQALGIGYGNTKQVLNRLNHYGISRQEFEDALKEISK